MVKIEIDLEEENREILRRYRALLRVCYRSKTRADRARIRKAFERKSPRKNWVSTP